MTTRSLDPTVAGRPSHRRSNGPTPSPNRRQPAPELGPRAQRTIERILEATRESLMQKGYGGTSIDDIARAAGVSRASFYTYFPTKRDALLTIGADASHGADALVDDLRALSPSWTSEDLAVWVHRYYDFLDDYGSFAVAWTQAAVEHEDLRVPGMKGHLRTCRRFGEALDLLRGTPLGDATEQGLLTFSMIDRGWALARLYSDTIDRERMIRNVTAQMLMILDRRA